jgi:TATA-box binding protein (TBP) (component of TFIID and TFIIIB)
MTSKEINTFLSGKTSVETFKKSIDIEVANYSNLMNKIGASINLKFNEDETIFINGTKIKKLLKNVLEDDLTAIHLSYICDCFTLSESIEYENELLNEIIYLLADPEINGGYKSKEELTEILNTIK